ncbi:ABC transporter ATP-binding protein [Treponema brennaborense]|uniref:Sulfate-transporting ATPase n=1 Tax=Treponema brennaborense (strain DSM 12168 / CIP 105900 / DD5/3) TaxID=906968 RepID=F4LKT0_TREBD|nr:ATP-binding cassette domain-containing protein [Treponema brennaborense]AEE15541.1 Sulfate-transporting ATPase [Treponema brennaborense DSM 12168]
MIEAEHVSRSFGTFRAVDDVSFSIQTGEIVGLLGPNGAGKTTTMRMITGFLEPSSGSIKIDGQDIASDPVRAKRKIGYMPESAPLYADMIVDDYLRYVADMQGVCADERLPVLVAECGLRDVMHKNIADLSRGYRQRVGLAHALMNDPEILILDEPTGGLDPNQIGEVRALIKEIGKTRTVIISTHILGEVEMLCDRVVIIAHGKIVADSPTAELRLRYGNGASLHVAAAGCTAAELQDALETACRNATRVDSDGSAVAITAESCTLPAAEDRPAACADVSFSAGTELRPAVFAEIVKRGWILYEMNVCRNSLEDVFRNVTAGGDADE